MKFAPKFLELRKLYSKTLDDGSIKFFRATDYDKFRVFANCGFQQELAAAAILFMQLIPNGIENLIALMLFKAAGCVKQVPKCATIVKLVVDVGGMVLDKDTAHSEVDKFAETYGNLKGLTHDELKTRNVSFEQSATGIF